jgi:hypothetical protein
VAEIPGAILASRKRLEFTIQWAASLRWEGRDYAVQIRPA